MNNFNNNKLVKFIKKNDTSIMTGAGIVEGLVIGGYLWYKTGKKVNTILTKEQQKLDEDNFKNSKPLRNLTFKEKFKYSWKCMLFPTINTVTSGILLGYSTKIGNKRLAALGAAYNLTETAFKEYVNKTKEVVGAEKTKEIAEKVAENNTKNEVATTEDKDIIVTPYGDIVVKEPATGVKFTTSWDRVELATMKIQRYAELGDGTVTLSAFFRELGLKPTDATELLGWDINKTGTIDISHVAILNEQGRPCGSLDYHGDLRSL